MKLILIIIFSIIFLHNSYAQCYPDRHNTTWYDGWISCQTAPSPNPVRGNSHWVQYNLGETYVLHELFIWNTNAPDLLDWGMQEVVIDVSNDGINWTEVGVFLLNQATGFNRHEGEFVVNLNSIKAKHILITGLNNFGGSCYGLSEVKINVDNTVGLDENECLRANVYPNPFTHELKLNIRDNCANQLIYYSIVDALGRVIVRESQISKGETKVILSDAKIQKGIYFVTLKTAGKISRIKVIKQ